MRALSTGHLLNQWERDLPAMCRWNMEPPRLNKLLHLPSGFTAALWGWSTGRMCNVLWRNSQWLWLQHVLLVPWRDVQPGLLRSLLDLSGWSQLH